MIKIAICDDDENYLHKIENILRDNFIQIYISTYYDSHGLLMDMDNKNYADIYILDIEIPNINGIELAKKIMADNKEAVIIFLTNYDEYVFEGYEVNAFRYIMKNKIDEKLIEAIKSAIERISRYEVNNNCVIKDNNGEIHIVKYSSIIYFEKYLKNVEFYIENGEVIKARNTLTEVLREIESKNFILIKKGVVVNIAHIKNIKGLKLIMTNDLVQYASRTIIKTVKDEIIRYYGG